jgi:hypothetical protein
MKQEEGQKELSQPKFVVTNADLNVLIAPGLPQL